MTDTRLVTCQNCGWKGTVGQCEPIAPRYLPERVPAGDVVPAGKCPECGASAMLDEPPKPSREPRIGIIITPEPERATHFGVRSTAQALANVMSMAANTYRYRVSEALLSGGLPRQTKLIPVCSCTWGNSGSIGGCFGSATASSS